MSEKFFNSTDIMRSFSMAWQDFWKAPMLALLFAPLLCSILCVWFSWQYVAVWLESVLVGFDPSVWWFFLLEFAINVAELIGLFLYFVVWVLVLQMFLSLFYAPLVVGYVRKKYYHHMAIEEEMSVWEGMRRSCKILSYFMLFLILASPLYLVPVVNVIVFSCILFYLFKEMMILDVVGCVIAPCDTQLFIQRYKQGIRAVLGALYLLSLIPVVNFLIPIFQMLTFTHFVFLSKQDFIGYVKGV